MKKIIIVVVIIALLMLLPDMIDTIMAQPNNPPGDFSGGGPIADPAGVPIDGGISALIAGGAAMLGRKYYKNKKAKEAKAE